MLRRIVGIAGPNARVMGELSTTGIGSLYTPSLRRSRVLAVVVSLVLRAGIGTLEAEVILVAGGVEYIMKNRPQRRQTVSRLCVVL